MQQRQPTPAQTGPYLVSDGASILMARKLASRLGLGVGISSGVTFLAAVKVQEMLGDAAVVTVFPDDNNEDDVDAPAGPGLP